MHIIDQCLICAYAIRIIFAGIMMMRYFNANAPKKATNLSINSDLLSKAREMKINLSATLEIELARKLKIKQREQWRQENAKAIQVYNDFVENEGVFSDGIRSF